MFFGIWQGSSALLCPDVPQRPVHLHTRSAPHLGGLCSDRPEHSDRGPAQLVLRSASGHLRQTSGRFRTSLPYGVPDPLLDHLHQGQAGQERTVGEKYEILLVSLRRSRSMLTHFERQRQCVVASFWANFENN